MSRFDQDVVGVLRRPRRTLAALAELRAPVVGLYAVLMLAGTYSVFCLLLWSQGHAPSRPGALGLIAAEGYYLFQAALMPLLFPVLWLVFSGVVHLVARGLGGRGAIRAGLTALGFAYAVPLTVAYVLPDLLAFLVFGFEAMVLGMRVYGPLALLWTLGLSTVAAKAAYKLPTPRAAAAVCVGFIAQGVLGGIFIR